MGRRMQADIYFVFLPLKDSINVIDSAFQLVLAWNFTSITLRGVEYQLGSFFAIGNERVRLYA